jgi:hypothetical protein
MTTYSYLPQMLHLPSQFRRFLIFLVYGVQIPYDTMTPLQAAVGVRQVGKKSRCCSMLCVVKYASCLVCVLPYQGLRPGLPKKAHPKLLDLMQRCWQADPSIRPAFPDILAELEDLLTIVQVLPEPVTFPF